MEKEIRKEAIKICRRVLSGMIYKTYADKRTDRVPSCIDGKNLKWIVKPACEELIPALNIELKKLGLEAYFSWNNALHLWYAFIQIYKIR